MRTLLSKLCGKFNMLYFWCIVTAHYPFLIILLFSQAFFLLKINVDNRMFIEAFVVLNLSFCLFSESIHNSLGEDR